MAPNYSSLHQQLLKKIAGALPKSATKKSVAFVQEFYALSTVNDLEELSPARAASIALICKKIFATRPKSEPKISIEKTSAPEGGHTKDRGIESPHPGKDRNPVGKLRSSRDRGTKRVP